MRCFMLAAHRRARIAIIGTTLFAAVTVAAPVSASATKVTTFCVKSYEGGEYCNQGHHHAIWWIDAVSSADAFCVMRATEGWAGARSASGKEYCASTESGGFVFQEFYGYEGYAQTHNRHSYSVAATPELEYS